MKNSKKIEFVDLVILGLAKDCETTLPSYFSFLSTLNSENITYFSIVGENGSVDNTRNLLITESQKGFLLVEDMDFLSLYPDRLERMALGREHLKEALEISGIRAKFVCIVDLDNIMEIPPTAQQLRIALNMLDSRIDAFGISATSKPHYYDLFAYERSDLSFANLSEEFSSAKRKPFSYYSFFKDNIYPAQQALTSSNYMTCISAFNGMGIYRFDDYHIGSYLSKNPKNICEHVTFNRAIANHTGKHMIISPILSFQTPADHIRRDFFSFWWQRRWKLISGMLKSA